MRPEMFLPFLVGYGLAIRECRAELMATQSWLQDEVAALREEIRGCSRRVASPACHRHPTRSRCDLELVYFVNPLSISAAQSMSASLRKRTNSGGLVMSALCRLLQKSFCTGDQKFSGL